MAHLRVAQQRLVEELWVRDQAAAAQLEAAEEAAALQAEAAEVQHLVRDSSAHLQEVRYRELEAEAEICAPPWRSGCRSTISTQATVVVDIDNATLESQICSQSVKAAEARHAHCEALAAAEQQAVRLQAELGVEIWAAHDTVAWAEEETGSMEQGRASFDAAVAHEGRALAMECQQAEAWCSVEAREMRLWTGELQVTRSSVGEGRAALLRQLEGVQQKCADMNHARLRARRAAQAAEALQAESKAELLEAEAACEQLEGAGGDAHAHAASAEVSSHEQRESIRCQDPAAVAGPSSTLLPTSPMASGVSDRGMLRQELFEVRRLQAELAEAEERSRNAEASLSAAFAELSVRRLQPHR